MDVSALRRLDDRLVPRWAQRVQGVRASVAAAPSPTVALRELDERYAATGALRVVRDEPLLGALVAGAVLLSGAGTGVALDWRSVASAGGPERVQLGVPPGADVEAHLAAAHDRAVELSRTSRATRHLALVSLRDPLTVGQTAGLLVESTLEVRRAWVRAPVPGGPELLVAETGDDPPRTLSALLAATAQRKAEEHEELLGLARSTAPGETETRETYGAAAATAAREAAAYAAGCGCVVALLVEGSAAELAELPALPVVRGVELAPRGTSAAAVDVVPLLPGEGR